MSCILNYRFYLFYLHIMDANISKLLEAERNANRIVEEAQKEKQAKIKEAEAYQKQQIESIRTEEEGKFNSYINEKYGNKNEMEAIEKEVEIEISQMKEKFNNGRAGVIELLLKNVIDVDLEVPDVVKGEYDKIM